MVFLSAYFRAFVISDFLFSGGSEPVLVMVMRAVIPPSDGSLVMAREGLVRASVQSGQWLLSFKGREPFLSFQFR